MENKSVTWKIINHGTFVNIGVLDNNISICLDEIILIRFKVYTANNQVIFQKLVCGRSKKLLEVTFLETVSQFLIH